MFIALDDSDMTLPGPLQIMAAVREAFVGLSTGDCVQPKQTVILLPDGAGDCILYSAYAGSVSAMGVKISPYLRARAEKGLAPVTAYTLVLDVENGTPRMLVDSRRLTTERTAATTLLAVQQLAAGTPESVAVIGTGEIGRGHARYARAVFPGATIALYSPTAAEASPEGSARRNLIEREVPGAGVSSSLEDAVTAADVVMLCTSSATPVLDVGLLRSDVVLTSVGTNIPDVHEIDWRHLSQLHVYCDYRKTCPDTAGDLRLAQAAKIWQASAIHADLSELLSGQSRALKHGCRYFRATGLAVEDLAVATLLDSSR